MPPPAAAVEPPQECAAPTPRSTSRPAIDALPLEDIAYDPESMPPPPGARGPHPADADAAEVADGVGDDVLPAAADTGDGDTGDTLPVPSTLDSPEPGPAPADADPATDDADGGVPTAQDEPAAHVPPSAAAPEVPVTTDEASTVEAPTVEAAEVETEAAEADEAKPAPAAPKETAKPARRSGRPQRAQLGRRDVRGQAPRLTGARRAGYHPAYPVCRTHAAWAQACGTGQRSRSKGRTSGEPRRPARPRSSSAA